MPLCLLFLISVLVRFVLLCLGTPFYFIYLFFKSIYDSYKEAYEMTKDHNCNDSDGNMIVFFCFFGLLIYFAPILMIFYFYPLNIYKLYLIPLKNSICGE